MTALSLRSIRFDSRTGTLAKNVAESDTLSAMLPTAEVAELVAAHDAATRTLAAAKSLIPELPDVFAKVDPTFRAGKTADPAKLIAELADAQAKRDQAQRTVAALAAVPERYAYELEALINRAADGFIEGLDARLQELLDEAEPVLTELAGVTNAEDAIAQDKTDAWKRWRELHAAYIALRREHLEVLRATADEPRNFGSRSAAVGHAFFLNLEEAVPNYARVMDVGQTPSLDGKFRDPFGFPIHDFTDPAHWMATVAQRARLQPLVEHADEALDRSTRAVQRAQDEAGGQPAPVGRPATDWSSALPGIAGIEFRAKPDPRR